RCPGLEIISIRSLGAFMSFACRCRTTLKSCWLRSGKSSEKEASVVPKLFAAGKSFKKLAAYLLHDADKAKTSERVAWTHTLYMASDTPALAVDEMLWTTRAAEDLKREAGIRAGGRPLENPVRHFSLNWHPSETPSREHMTQTVESFLAHMKWDEHQALIVCHTDRQPHVHVMLCGVHPETGKALDTSFEKRRAQEWA